MATSKKKQAIARIKRKTKARVTRQQKAVQAAASRASRTAQHASRPARRAKRSRKAILKGVRHYGKAHDPLTAAVDQAVKVQTNAMQVAGHLSLTGIDVIETAATLLLAPAIWLGTSFGGPSKTSHGKLLPWPAPTPVGAPEKPLVRSVPVAA